MKKNFVVIFLIVVLVAIGYYLFTAIGNKYGRPGTSSAPNFPTPIINSVTITSNGFTPKTLTIKKGETVRWTNTGSASATVNSAPHPTHNLHKFLNLGELAPGSSFETVFKDEGTFNYHNHFIPPQTGTVIVK